MFTVLSMSSTPIRAPRRTTPKKARLRKRLPACLPNFYTTKTKGATHEVQCIESVESVVKVPSRPSVLTSGRRLDITGTNHSWSDTEEITFPSQSRRKRCQSNSSPCMSLSSPSPSILTSPVAKKGVTYGHNGTLVSCRFCEILESGNETFLYQDEDVVVFRPLAPVVVSHILVVPRRHIRNVSELTPDEATLLRRMREIAAMILRKMPRPLEVLAPSKAEQAYDIAEDCTDEEDFESDFKFAFHSPPFNSIDHVHMHAFRTRDGRFGCVGFIKYRTETWWCRSFDEIMTRLGLGSRKQRNRIDAETVESATQKKEHRRRHHVSRPPCESANGSMVLMTV